MRFDVVILHAVVLVHRKCRKGFVAVVSFEDQVRSGRDHGIRRADAAFLREKQPAAHGEGRVDFPAVHVGDHGSVAVIALIGNIQRTDAEFFQNLGNEGLDKPRDGAVSVRVAVRQVMVQIAHTKDAVIFEPFFFRVGQRAAGDAGRVILDPQGIDIVRFLHRELILRLIERRQKVRPARIDAKVIIRGAEWVKECRVWPVVGSVAFRHQRVDFVFVEIVQHFLMGRIGHDFGGNGLLREESLERAYHRAVQYANLFPGKGGKRRGDAVVGAVFHHIVGFAAHRSLGVADDALPLLRFRQPRQEVDFSVQEHLVQFGKAAVDIFVFPARVLGELAVIFIGVAAADSALLGSLLKYLVFEIADLDGRRGRFGKDGPRQRKKQTGERQEEDFSHTDHFLCGQKQRMRLRNHGVFAKNTSTAAVISLRRMVFKR